MIGRNLAVMQTQTGTLWRAVCCWQCPVNNPAAFVRSTISQQDASLQVHRAHEACEPAAVCCAAICNAGDTGSSHSPGRGGHGTGVTKDLLCPTDAGAAATHQAVGDMELG